MSKSAVGEVSTSPSDTIETLHARAIAVDAAGRVPVLLAHLWSELVDGTTTVVAAFVAGDRCYMVVRSNANGQNLTLTARTRTIVERILLGEAYKVVAMDLCLAISSVANTASQALRSMGLNCTAPVLRC